MIHTLYDRKAMPAMNGQGSHTILSDLPQSVTRSENASLASSLNAGLTDVAQSAVVAPEHIIVFSGNMSAEHKDYVTNSLIYSELAATHQARAIINPLQRRNAWYEKKTEIMKGLGWAGFSDAIRRHTAISQKFTMDQVGLEVLQRALAAAAFPGMTAASLVTLAQGAIEKLRATGESLRLFEREALSHHDGKFNIAVCVESSAGDVILITTNIYFIATQSVTNVLFWEWQSSEVDVASAGNKLVLNERRFQKGHEKLAERLDDYLFDNILNLPIGS